MGDDDVRHAAEHALVGYALEQGDGELQRALLLGPDLPEIVVLELDDGIPLAIHAMRMRPSYNDLLPRAVSDGRQAATSRSPTS